VNLLDVIILALIGFGVWMGYRKGAVIEIARIVGLVLAFILAVQLMDTVGIMLVSNFNLPEELISILGFAITFVVVMVLVWFGAKIIQFVLGKAHLSGINRFVGGAIGGIKWALLLSVAFLLFGTARIPSSELRAGSAFYEGISVLAPRAWKALSTSLPSDSVDLPDRLRPIAPDIPDPVEETAPPESTP